MPSQLAKRPVRATFRVTRFLFICVQAIFSSLNQHKSDEKLGKRLTFSSNVIIIVANGGRCACTVVLHWPQVSCGTPCVCVQRLSHKRQSCSKRVGHFPPGPGKPFGGGVIFTNCFGTMRSKGSWRPVAVYGAAAEDFPNSQKSEAVREKRRAKLCLRKNPGVLQRATGR